MSDSEDILKDELRRLINVSISDERRVIEILVDAITEKHTEPALVEQAVRQTVYKYENKLRVFAIAAANRQLRRILRLLDAVDRLEEILNDPIRLQGMDDKELIRLYTITQGNLTTSLDYIKKVIDMRIELQQAANSILTTKEKVEIDTLSGLPALTSSQRDRVRRLVGSVVDEIINIDDIEDENEDIIDIE